MATRKPTAGRRTTTPAAAVKKAPARGAAKPEKSARSTGADEAAARNAPARRSTRPASSTPASRPAARKASATRKPDTAARESATTAAQAKRLTASERERRFNLMLQAACLKAGTAAAISTISSKVPFLGRLAPAVLGSIGDALVLAKVQQQLVQEVIALYELELSDVEERGVILLATAVNIGAQQISKTTVEELIEQLSGRLYRPVISRVLPLASVATEVAAAVASTYAVGKRTQALCTLPGSGAKDLGELLRSMSGIDQTRLYKWTGDAFSLALKPFRGALLAMIPGLGAWTRPGR
jgi:hypothetical protein